MMNISYNKDNNPLVTKGLSNKAKSLLKVATLSILSTLLSSCATTTKQVEQGSKELRNTMRNLEKSAESLEEIFK